MSKRHLRELPGPFKAVKPYYVFVAAGICCLVCLSALRVNNLTMVHLRNDVYKADKENGDVQGTLTKLQRHVTSHMNTDLTPSRNSVYPPIQLKYTYERLQAAANGAVSNDQIYNDAQKHCEATNPNGFSGSNRIPCIEAYVKSHSPKQAAQIPEDLYKFDFISPRWSPDIAGWSLIVTVVVFLSGVALVIYRRWPARS